MSFIWFRVNTISIETWEACLQPQESSSAALVWPPQPRRLPRSPPPCHWDNQHHRHSPDQLKVTKCGPRSVSAPGGQHTGVCSNTQPRFPSPRARPLAPGLCLNGEPVPISIHHYSQTQSRHNSNSYLCLTLTFSCANSIPGPQWPVLDIGWVIGQFSFPLSSFKFSLHFITNAIWENASAYYINAVLLSMQGQGGRNIFMFLTTKKCKKWGRTHIGP